MGNPRYRNGFELTLHPDKVRDPLSWTRPRIVFVNSMSDLFHPDVPDDFIWSVFDTMTEADRHTFQVLTKRPQRAASVLDGHTVADNIWIGTSIESDKYTFRANYIRKIDTRVRFLSCEPLLGPLPSLDLTDIGWVIVGGESGPGHRPIKLEWVRALRDSAVLEDVPFFFKQWGGHTPKAGGRDLDGAVWDQMPDHRSTHMVATF